MDGRTGENLVFGPTRPAGIFADGATGTESLGGSGCGGRVGDCAGGFEEGG